MRLSATTKKINIGFEFTIDSGTFIDPIHNGVSPVTLNGNPGTYSYVTHITPVNDIHHSVWSYSLQKTAETKVRLSNRTLGTFKLDDEGTTYEASFIIEIYDYQGVRWRLGNRERFSKEVTISIPIETLTPYPDDDTTLHYDGGWYPLTVYEPGAYPTWDIFTDINFYNLPNQSTNQTEWQADLNGTDPAGIWVNDKVWDIQWKNYDPSYSGDGNGTDGDTGGNKRIYPDMNLFWTVSDSEETSLTPEQVIQRSMNSPAGFQSYHDYIDNGGTYNNGAGITQDEGYISLDLEQIYTPGGVQVSGFSGGKYRLDMVMAVINPWDGSVSKASPVTSYPIKYEPAIMGTLAIENAQVTREGFSIQLNDVFNGIRPVSPVRIRYKIDDNTNYPDSWTTIEDFSRLLRISSELQPNTPQTVYIGLDYMDYPNIDNSSSVVYTEALYTYPKSDKPDITLTPHLVGTELTYDIQITANVPDDTDLNYAIFIEKENNVNYADGDINTSRIQTDYYSGNDANFFTSTNNITFTDIPENELELRTVIVLVKNTVSGYRGWYRLYLDLGVISGGFDDVNNIANGTGVQIPKEVSNRYSKALKINRITAGSVAYSPSATREHTYKTDKPLSSIALEVEDLLPVELGYDHESFIKYSLVIGDKEYPITPINRMGSAPTLYHFNSNIQDSERSRLIRMNESFQSTDNPIREFTVKVTLSADPAHPDITPVVYKWRAITRLGTNTQV